MEFLLFAVPFITPLVALFAIGAAAQRSAEPAVARAYTPRALWSTVVRGNEVLEPTTPYREFARR